MIHFTLSFFYIERHFFLFVCFFFISKENKYLKKYLYTVCSFI